MKYLICTLIFSILFSVWIVQKIHNQIKKKLIKSFLYKNIKDSTCFSLFASSLIEITTKKILEAPQKEQQKLLETLIKNNFGELIRHFQKKDKIIAVALLSLFYPEQEIKLTRLKPQSKKSQIVLCLLDEIKSEYENMEKHFKNMPSIGYFSTYKALKRLIEARCLFLKADLKKASKNVIKSARFFRKKHMNNELAYTYFMLGEIYQRAGFYDACEMMFRAAEQIYEKTGHTYGRHQILSAFAENCLKQQRFDDAQSYLDCALKACKKNNLRCADILNQKAMLLNIKKDYQNAQKTANAAFKKHKELKNDAGIALSLTQMAIAAYHSRDYQKAKRHTLSAQKHFKAAKDNLSSIDLFALLVHTSLELSDKKSAKKYFNALKRKQKKYPQIISSEMMDKLQKQIIREDIRK